MLLQQINVHIPKESATGEHINNHQVAQAVQIIIQQKTGLSTERATVCYSIDP